MSDELKIEQVEFETCRALYTEGERIMAEAKRRLPSLAVLPSGSIVRVLGGMLQRHDEILGWLDVARVGEVSDAEREGGD